MEEDVRIHTLQMYSASFSAGKIIYNSEKSIERIVLTKMAPPTFYCNFDFRENHFRQEMIHRKTQVFVKFGDFWDNLGNFVSIFSEKNTK